MRSENTTVPVFPISKHFAIFSELQIPEKANVYYAINTTHDLNFILREKSEDLSSVGGTVMAGNSVNGSGIAGSLGEATPKGSRRPRDNSKARRKLLGITL